MITLLLLLAQAAHPPTLSASTTAGYRVPLRAHSACPSPGVTITKRLADLTSEAQRNFFRAFDGGLADADEDYNAGDTIRTMYSRRLILLLNRGDRWVVWYEQASWGEPQQRVVAIRGTVSHPRRESERMLGSAYTDAAFCRLVRRYFAQ